MQADYEVYDVDYLEECAILHGQALREAFPEDGPCETCQGTGSVTDYEDVCGDGGSRMQVWAPCPDCIEVGICPMCGSDNLDDDDYCTCHACGFRMSGYDQSVVANPKATADAAVAALQEQARRWDKVLQGCTDYKSLAMPLAASVDTRYHYIEIGHGMGHAPDVPCWYWEKWLSMGCRWPIDGCGGYASADEALSAALEMR